MEGGTIVKELYEKIILPLLQILFWNKEEGENAEQNKINKELRKGGYPPYNDLDRRWWMK